MELSEAVRRRRMVRRYLPDRVDPAALERILDTARRAPSAGFAQGQAFVVVQDAGTRRGIAEICREPAYLAKGFDAWLSVAPVHVVCCVGEAAYHDRYREPDKLRGGAERKWPVPFWYVDAGCALMLLLLAAVDEGLGAGFLGWSREQTDQVRELLEIPHDVLPVGLVTIGHPAPDRRPASLSRGWKPASEVVHRERFGG